MNARIVTGDTVRVNGADIYYELRGSGSPLLLIHGTMLDATCYDGAAEFLAEDNTVITYDRRGYSRSRRPLGWAATSIQEQADDAAWLLRALGHGPADVFGSSSGGLIALDMVLRHPDVVNRAVLHEPSLFTPLPQAFLEEQFAGMNALVEEAMTAGGPGAALRALLGALSESGTESLESASLKRWSANAELAFGLEFPAMLLAYAPSAESIAAIETPLVVARAEMSLPVCAAAAEWLTDVARVDLNVVAGSHLAYFERPQATAGEIGGLLGGLKRDRSSD